MKRYLALLFLCAIGAWLPPPDTLAAESASERTIDLEAVIETDPATLYRLWTTSDGARTVFPGADASIGDAVGTEYRIAFDPSSPDGSVNGTAGCRIRELIPDRRVVFDWRGPAWADEMNVIPLPTWVEIDLEPLAGGTTALSLRHHGFGTGAGWDRAFEFFTGAWSRTLHGLEQRFASRPELGAPDVPEPLFVFLLGPGPRWDPARPVREQPRILNHAAYLRSLRERGVLTAGGPFADLAEHRTGILALGVLKVPDLEVALRYLRADPAVQAGTFVYELRPWAASLPAPR